MTIALSTFLSLIVLAMPALSSLPDRNLWITPPAKSAAQINNFLNLGHLDQWTKAYQNTYGFKFYLVQLDPSHPNYLGAEGVMRLKTFASQIKKAGKKLAFEVGSVYAEACVDGPYYPNGMPMIAQRAIGYEGGLLSSFRNANIDIDTIVMDGPFIRVFDSLYSSCVKRYDAKMTLDFVASEVVTYMKAMRQIFPRVQFELLVNFPNWDFLDSASINGVGGRILNSKGDVIRYETVLNKMATAAKLAKIPLAGLQIDNPYNFMIYNNGHPQSGQVTGSVLEKRWTRLKNLRVLSQQLTLNTLLILNSETFEGPNPTDSQLDQASLLFATQTTQYANQLRARGLANNSYVAQSWYAVPRFILPENQANTFMSLILDLSRILGLTLP